MSVYRTLCEHDYKISWISKGSHTRTLLFSFRKWSSSTFFFGKRLPLLYADVHKMVNISFNFVRGERVSTAMWQKHREEDNGFVVYKRLGVAWWSKGGGLVAYIIYFFVKIITYIIITTCSYRLGYITVLCKVSKPRYPALSPKCLPLVVKPIILWRRKKGKPTGKSMRKFVEKCCQILRKRWVGPLNTWFSTKASG